MMSYSEINRLSEEAAVRAERRNLQPKRFPGATAESLRSLPNLGDYRPSNWRLVDLEEIKTPADMRPGRLFATFAKEPYLMVDKSGFGSSSEPALTFSELLSLVRANPELGFAFVVEQMGEEWAQDMEAA
jgi:hypothetical protein